MSSMGQPAALLSASSAPPLASQREAAASRIFSTGVRAAVCLDSILVKWPDSYICVKPCDTGTRLVLPVAAYLLLS
jgi:hypothetical protein